MLGHDQHRLAGLRGETEPVTRVSFAKNIATNLDVFACYGATNASDGIACGPLDFVVAGAMLAQPLAANREVHIAPV